MNLTLGERSGVVLNQVNKFLSKYVIKTGTDLKKYIDMNLGHIHLTITHFSRGFSFMAYSIYYALSLESKTNVDKF